MVDDIEVHEEAEEEYADDEISFTDRDLSDGQLDKLYEKGRFRLIQDRNDFMLPQVRDLIKKERWISAKPKYQRRHRWSKSKQSALIESFLMNVPVPPIYLYESDINRYEVMDGQQRLNAIMEFFNNEYRLSGLKTWPALNGKNFSELPSKITRGLERAKISSSILNFDDLKEVGPVDDIRSLVFERLNTGGVRLNAQELRNCVFSGALNDLVMELTGARTFTDIWGIPPHEENFGDDGDASAALNGNALFRSMGDCQLVLRFFAFREAEYLRGSARKILDECAKRYRIMEENLIQEFRSDFLDSLALSHELFEDNVFRLPENEQGKSLLSKPLFDAVMISLHRLKDDQERLRENAPAVKTALEDLLGDAKQYEVLVGRGNTAEFIAQRIDLLTEAFGAAAPDA